MDVDEMQTKLATWAKDPGYRTNDVHNLVYDMDFLRWAYGNVKSNSGANTPGVDGQTAKDFAENRTKNLKDLQEELKSESYNPDPVRRTYIPKGDGRKRPLGIPTIRDRIVQESLRKSRRSTTTDHTQDTGTQRKQTDWTTSKAYV